MADLTETLSSAARGDGHAADALFVAVYDHLRAIAQQKLGDERVGHTLAATALVHEAYMKLVDADRVDWQGQTHFCAVAARAMRQVLTDHARGRNREKRGGAWRRVGLDEALGVADEREIDLLALHEALETLATLDARQARVAELRLLGGMPNESIAIVLDASKRTVERDWLVARAWLRRALAGESPRGS